MPDGDPVQFNSVFIRENVSINLRRDKLRRPPMALEDEADGDTKLTLSDGTTPMRPTEGSEVVGLALSGGGIRSAAFCLGALQALYAHKVLDKIDYMSTVSGGGYIGTALSSGMTATGGHFPFKSYLSEDETPSLQHVRDYSNYLFPHGASNFVSNVAVYLRGLMANALLVLPWLLLAAAFTVAAVPTTAGRNYPNIIGFKVHNIFPFDYFVLSAYLGLILLVLVLGWALVRSRLPAVNEVTGWAAKAFGALVVLLLVVAFCELQPFILKGLFGTGPLLFLPAFIRWIRSVVLWLTPFAAAVSFVAQKFNDVFKNALESDAAKGWRKALIAKLIVLAASVILPLLLWLVYLEFSYWGACKDATCIRDLAPAWLHAAAQHVPPVITKTLFQGDKHLVAQLYVLVAVLCLILSLLLRPNANSLHPLYRDRLGKAFIFKPEKIVLRDSEGVQPELSQLSPENTKLSTLSESDSPYHLINTALNLQSSKTSNRRGRNADFFMLSRNYVGSPATGYVETSAMEAAVPTLGLATAIATSGAAASADMGSATIRTLSPTLALLNIRLGYWLRNPRKLGEGFAWDALANFYYFCEMFGYLNEWRHSVYLTDGGHIENLGLYELLRRRCKVIIVVDAEADPQMAFGAFNILERYALIDLGVRIDLPWQKITDMTKETGKAIDKDGDAPKNAGPHVAIGEICYPGKRRGILVYIKSSLTGDENDYVFHYKKRYSDFPHETTLDQLFSEEQFEAYRALGFHATHRFFDRRDDFAHIDPDANPCARDDVALLDKIFPPHTPPDRCALRKHETFADWLEAKPDAEADYKPASDDTSSLAAVAEATGKIAAAADKTARRLTRPRPSRRANPE